MKLHQIATIQIGYSFRSRIERADAGNVSVIQMKDLTDDDQVNVRGLTKIHFEKSCDDHLVCKGDLIFRSRGATNTAAIIKEDPGQALMAAPLIRIRVSNDQVLPDYLCWFINQKESQSFLATHARGTFQKMIGVDSLQQLEVSVPSLERQKSVIAMADLLNKENTLMKELMAKRKRHLEKILMQSSGEEKP